MTVGERIRQKRIELKLTQEELASKMGYLNKSSICKAETSPNYLTMPKLKKFAQALGVTDAYLLGWEEEDWTEKNYQDYLNRNLRQVYVDYGYKAYQTLYIFEHMDEEERKSIFEYALFMAQRKGLNIPSEDVVRKSVKN